MPATSTWIYLIIAMMCATLEDVKDKTWEKTILEKKYLKKLLVFKYQHQLYDNLQSNKQAFRFTH